MKKVLLLVNGSAGRKQGKDSLYDIVRALALRDCEVTVYPIEPGTSLDSSLIIAAKAADFDVVACFGGDGTLNHVVSGLLDNGIRKPVGYIPGGSTNDFVKNFTDDIDIESVCDGIANGTIYSYDIGKLNDRYFNYVAAFGAFTEVSYSTDQAAKNLFGHGAYVVKAVSSLSDALSYSRKMRVYHDDQITEGEFIYGAVSNSPFVGGMTLPYSRDAKLNDGLFEAVFVTAPKNAVELATVLSDLATGYLDSQYVMTFETKALKVESDMPVDWTVDGEFGGSYKSAEIEVLPRAVDLMIR